MREQPVMLEVEDLAKHFTPSLIVRFGLRRMFDFLRGVDGLIWTIVLSRAFGPGALAILLTDTDSYGKMSSEFMRAEGSSSRDDLSRREGPRHASDSIVGPGPIKCAA